MARPRLRHGWLVRLPVGALLCVTLAVLLGACTLLSAGDPPAEEEDALGSELGPVPTDLTPAAAELRLGLLLPGGDESGATGAPGDAAVSGSARRGIEMLLNEYGNRISGLEVRLLEPEHEASGSATAAAAAVQELISAREVHAVIAGLYGDALTAASVTAEAAATPFFALSAGDLAGVPAGDENQARALARYAASHLASRRAAIVFPLTSAQRHRQARRFAAEFAAAGGEESYLLFLDEASLRDGSLDTGGTGPGGANPDGGAAGGSAGGGGGNAPGAENEPPDPGTYFAGGEAVAFDEALNVLAQEPPDVWFLALDAQQAVQFLPAIRAIDPFGTVLGPAGWDRYQDRQGQQQEGGDASVLDGALVVVNFHPSRNHPATNRFVQAYRQAYGEEPSEAAALAYDAAARLFSAVESAVLSGRFDVGDTSATRTSLNAMLRQPGQFAGATGLWISTAGDAAEKSVLIARLDAESPTRPIYVDEVLP